MYLLKYCTQHKSLSIKGLLFVAVADDGKQILMVVQREILPIY
jgi:hypothetical protein